MAKDATINVRMSTAQKERLAIVADKEDRSINQIIRLAIESYLAGKDES